MPDEIKPGQTWRHNKTGHLYLIAEPGTVINATNAQDGQKMVVYHRADGDDHSYYVREESEFRLKFTLQEPC